MRPGNAPNYPQGQAHPPGRALRGEHLGRDLLQKGHQFPGHPHFVQFRQLVKDAGIEKDEQRDQVVRGVGPLPEDLGGHLFQGIEVDAHQRLE